MMNTFLSGVGGKKSFWMLALFAAVLFKDKLGLGEETIKWLAGAVGLGTVGQGVADGLSKGQTSHAS